MHAVQLKGITKRFGKVLANDHIDIDITKGNIHAIIGENGAGKSTIMEILYGFYQADEGEIFVNGEKTDITSPHIAIKNGIGMVHQHFMLIPPMTVAENIILGVENPGKGGTLKLQEAESEIRSISEEYGLHISPEVKVEELSVGLQQRVEILKALYRHVDILILDEPTAVLTPLEVKEFFDILNKLKAQGKTIILITHKLEEVLEISDDITVMRHGKKVGGLETKDATAEKLATMMVGREVLLRVEKTEAKPGDPVLEVNNLCYKQDDSEKLKNVSFKIHAGEILAIAGVEGNGQTELIEGLTGLKEFNTGTVRFKGQDITNINARKMRDLKISHVPADRLAHGFIKTYSNAENQILGFHHKEPFCNKFGFLNEKKIEEHAQQLIEEFDIRPPLSEVSTGNLSGGNQQKLVIAREFTQNPDLLIISQPTRGVDIGAIEFIHKQIIEQRDKNVAVLLVSAELEEIRSLTDRTLVMYEGEIVGELPGDEFDMQKIGLMMTGQHQ